MPLTDVVSIDTIPDYGTKIKESISKMGAVQLSGTHAFPKNRQSLSKTLLFALRFLSYHVLHDRTCCSPPPV